MVDSSPQIAIIFTGFGKFRGVDDNPTTHIVKNLPDYLSKHSIPGVELSATHIFETSAKGVEDALPELKKLRKEDKRNLWFHIGVHSGAQKFLLETKAFNDCSFCCPDERGWQPNEEVIEKSNGNILHCYNSPLSEHFDECVKSLSEKGYHLECSSDAGRFICNYTYYKTLDFCHKSDGKDLALFVHVPPFSVFPLEKQLEALHSIISYLVSKIN